MSMKKVVVNCQYIVTIPVEIEVEDNVKDEDIELMATDIAEESDLLKEYHYDFYDLEIEG